MSNKLEEARRIINGLDSEMAELFVKRMRAAELVCEYKTERGLPILDQKREDAVVEKNSALVEDEVLKEYYVEYIKHLMSLSRDYQHRLQREMGAQRGGDCSTEGKTVRMNLGADSYDITVERGSLSKSAQYLNLDRKVLVVTDSGVPEEYAKTLAAQCKQAVVCTLDEGEASKSMECLEKLLKLMLDNSFSRRDCVVAVGGGVVGDLSGFAASLYMRGIDFYNVPTTLLSQIDSSIGGKTAINFCGVKNVVGAFHQPKRVLIDPGLLKTLPKRQIANGLAEAIKMALTSDKELFELFESKDIEAHLDEIIIRSLLVKKSVVEKDEKESGLRRILNFGHTVGHGIESSSGMSELYHGECVALGMIPMCGEGVRERLIGVLKKCDLYRTLEYDWQGITDAAFHDKKASGGTVTVILVSEVGSFEIKNMNCLDVIDMAKEVLEGLE